MKNYFKIVFLLLFIILTTYFLLAIKPGLSKGESTMIWEEKFQKWYDWKENSNLSSEEKEIFEYFKRIEKITSEIKNIWRSSKAPENAAQLNDIQIIEQGVEELKGIQNPDQCLGFHQANIEWIKSIKNYYEIQLEKNTSELEKDKIITKILELEGIIYEEFFKILKNTGLLTEYEKEIQALK